MQVSSIFPRSEYPDECGEDPWPYIQKSNLLIFSESVL